MSSGSSQSHPIKVDAEGPQVKGKHLGGYSVYFSSEAPAPHSGINFGSGDIWLSTPQFEFARRERNDHGTKANMSKYVETGVVSYYNGNLWKVIDADASKEKDPKIQHPDSRSVRIDMQRLSWRSNTSFSSGASRANKSNVKEEPSIKGSLTSEPSRASTSKQKEEPSKEDGPSLHSESIRQSVSESGPPVDPRFMDIDWEENAQEQGKNDERVQNIPNTDKDDDGFPRPSCPENQWIVDLYKEWTSVPISYVKPTQEAGAAALRLLMELQEPLPKCPHPDSKVVLLQHQILSEVKPRETDILLDLMSMTQCRGVDIATQTIPGSIAAVEVLQSIIYSGDKEWKDGDKIFSILNLPAPNLMKCRLKCPEDISGKQPDIVHFSSTGMADDIHWESVICGRGALTNCHIDEWIMAIYMAHVSGKKLWFFWPPTPENIKIFANHHLSKDTFTICEGIKMFSGLELLLLDDDQVAWHMVPGTIHAVMTFSKLASHTGFYYICKKQLSQVQDVVGAVLDVIKELDQTGNSHGVARADDILENLSSVSLPLWTSLTEKMKKKRCPQKDHKDIEAWIKKVQALVSLHEGRRPWMAQNQEPSSDDGSRNKKRLGSEVSDATGSKNASKTKKRKGRTFVSPLFTIEVPPCGLNIATKHCYGDVVLKSPEALLQKPSEEWTRFVCISDMNSRSGSGGEVAKTRCGTTYSVYDNKVGKSSHVATSKSSPLWLIQPPAGCSALSALPTKTAHEDDSNSQSSVVFIRKTLISNFRPNGPN
ncbi:hypothetical protein BDZ97DRAFT_1927461 [Flammula alnicola]|nr:hypothetical protein BDZ97DRAFT_1927461 [Flammula alnicola]